MPLFAHLGVGLIAKRYAPKINTTLLIIATFLPDILSLFALLFTSESGKATPWTHGLIMDLIWSFLLGLIIGLIMRDSHSGFFIGCVAFSHWILDFIGWPLTGFSPSYTDSVPIFFDMSVTAGLGLYSTPLGAYLTDVIVLLVGFIIYISSQKKLKNRNHETT